MAIEAPTFDEDLVSPFTRDGAVEALKRGDHARFALWFEQERLGLGEHPSAALEADLLVRGAQVLQEANDYRGATELLARAVKLIHGKDDVTEKMVTALLLEVGGEVAVKEALVGAQSEARATIGKRIAEVQRELIEIQAYGFKVAERFGEGDEGKQKLAARIAELKAENQALSNEKAKFM